MSGGSSGSSGSMGSSGSSGSMGSSGGMSGGSSGSSGSMGSSGGMSGGSSGTAGSAGSGGSGVSAGGIPDIPSGTGTGTGDLDDVFGKSLGDYDGTIAGEREVISSSGGGSARGAGRREQGDADAVATGAERAGGSMPDVPSESDAGSSAGSGSSGGGGMGTVGGEGEREGGELDESERDSQKVVKLPDDIPVDGSGDDVVGRQIREAAIAMQDVDPKAAEALWDEYRKHTGIQ